MSHESEIRDLVHAWASAIREGNLDGVAAAHTDGIVMYDVPPPFEGVLGLDDYRATWPPFFAYVDTGATFEIESLTVTAGDDVAFAHGLVICGTEEERAAQPGQRLRLTMGLTRVDGRWLIAHEHHSFPIDLPEEG